MVLGQNLVLLLELQVQLFLLFFLVEDFHAGVYSFEQVFTNKMHLFLLLFVLNGQRFEERVTVYLVEVEKVLQRRIQHKTRAVELHFY